MSVPVSAAQDIWERSRMSQLPGLLSDESHTTMCEVDADLPCWAAQDIWERKLAMTSACA